MPGSLNDILPEPISKENEKVLLGLLKRKMKGAAGLAVQLLHAMEERFGPEAREVLRDMPTIKRRRRRQMWENLKQTCRNSVLVWIRGVPGRINGNG